MKLKDYLIGQEEAGLEGFKDYGDAPERDYLIEYHRNHFTDYMTIGARSMGEAQAIAEDILIPGFEIINISEA